MWNIPFILTLLMLIEKLEKTLIWNKIKSGEQKKRKIITIHVKKYASKMQSNRTSHS